MTTITAQNILLASGQFDREKDYWMENLSREFHSLDLPTDSRASFQRQSELRELTIVFPDELSKALIHLSNGSDQRLFMALLSGFGILLSKYTGHQDICVGTAIFRQTEPGEFLNKVLPLRHQVLPEWSIKELLQEVRQTLKAAVEHQNYPILRLIEELQVPQQGNSTPFLEATCLLDVLHDQDSLEQVSSELQLLFSKKGNSLELLVRYVGQRYQLPMMERMIEHLVRIYQVIVTQPDQKIAEIACLSEAEVRELVLSFNDNRIDFPRDQSFDRLFEEQVKKTPHRKAVTDGKSTLTYQELNERSNRLARHFIQQGLRPGTKIGIYMKRNVDTLVAILAVFKAGGAYVPIDPDYPQHRILYIVQKSEIAGLITQPDLLDGLEPIRASSPELKYFYVFGQTDQSIESLSGEEIDRESAGTDLAYIIFTSGTTGQPKGVMVHHRGMINHIFAKINDLSLCEDDLVTQTASLCFDISVWQYLAVLLVGGSVLVIDTETVMDTQALHNVLRSNHVTVAEVVPSLLSVLLDLVQEWPNSERSLPDLRWMAVTGEELPAPLVRRWFACYSEIPLVNMYGPTEASDDITHHIIREMPSDQQIVVPIGIPIQNTHIYILDQNQCICPRGVKGEIGVAGPGVGYGYYKDDERTQKVFVANPYASWIDDPDYQVLYRTGDVGRITEDGFIEYFGRMDNQVKIRGYRIELSEIEQVMRRHPAVKDAVVLALSEETGAKYLCAYVVPQEEFSARDVREYLFTVLPEYMVPMHYVKQNVLPLTPNGKVDRGALPKPGIQDRIDTSILVSATTETEKALTHIWAHVLQLDPNTISTRDNFFALGGHSLKINAVAAQVAQQFGVQLPLRTMFNHPTIQELGNVIDGSDKTIMKRRFSVEARSYYPVTAAQRKFFILQQLNPADTSLHITAARSIEGELSREKVEHAFQGLLDRHESLRTSFDYRDGQVVQIVHDSLVFRLEVSEASEEQLEASLATFVRPFDLRQAPLLRAGLIRIAPEKHLLLFDMHHIISDGVSMDILVEDFVRLYAGVTLPALEVQQKEFAVWQESALESGELQADYWADLFTSPAPLLSIPTDYERPEALTYPGATIEFEISAEERQQLQELATQEHATLYMVLLSVYNILLAKYSGQEDIVVGTPVAGRKFAEFDEVIGMFINTIPLRNYPKGEKTYREFLAEVREHTLASFEQADYPIDLFVQTLGLEPNTGRQPLFDTIFVLQNMDNPEGELELEDMIVKNYPLQNNTAKLDLHLAAYPVFDRLICKLDYRSDLFRRDTMEQFVSDFKSLLQQVMEDPQRLLQDFELTREVALIQAQGVDWDFEF
ncbi:edeine non-ribosomal peptide synthetase EdeK [Brevibacillus sp. HB2.2]|uniref:edeine non-ribosomal peptide synthetase EdeK n=1 Tax=Brevibacillus sp. HB2.2 TaxID=2738846 RepID=UPI00156BD590|nr:edeine non-ribosomal peptide synthetase EdeK [Brevibacillus sp. HB2.2]NRS50430.1 edeine non-ribosomal peptide synthetase EdeK [Brevibacillus sp. HB2.2]